MKYKNNIKNLIELRKDKNQNFNHKEEKGISSILKNGGLLIKKNKIKTKLINLKSVRIGI